MAKLNDLIEEFSDCTGMRDGETRIRARHLREAGLISSGGRGRGGADVTALDCARFLVGALGAERAINGPEIVRVAHNAVPIKVFGDWSTLREGPSNEWMKAVGKNSARSKSNNFLSDTDIVTALAILIEDARQYQASRTAGYAYVNRIRIDRNRPYAEIEVIGTSGGQVRQTYLPVVDRDRPNRVMTPRFHLTDLERVSPIQLSGSCNGQILGLMSNLLGPPDDEVRSVSEIRHAFSENGDVS